MTITLVILIKCFAAMLAGVIAGNGAVYFFNKMPASWLCDYGQVPALEMSDPYVQRVKSYPWKYIFTMLFIVIGIKLVIDDVRFAVCAMISIWLLLEMAIADIKYRIVPDQLVILLAASGIGFVSFHGSVKECALGALVGFGIMAFVALVGKLAYKRETLGGGDIKLFASLGIILGVGGILIVYAMTALLSAAHFVVLMTLKKIKKTDSLPMVPYIAVSASFYMIFIFGTPELLLMSI